MNKSSILAVFLVLFLLVPASANAHSGRTDSSGGHNCNVGACAGTYHYHNGGTGGYVAPAPVAPVYTATPTLKPTKAPTPKPTIAPTKKPTTNPSAVISTATPRAVVSPVATTIPSFDSTDDGTLAVVGAVGVVGLLGYLIRMGRKM